jgi:phosphatidylglycerophosphatase A
MNEPDGVPPAGATAPDAGAALATPPAASADESASAAPRRPDRRFLFASPWHFIALGFGSGLPRFAPGTWGTLAGWALFVLLDPFYSDLAWLGLIIAGLYFGAWASHRTGAALGRPDSGHIVIDEIVAFWIVLVMLPDTVELQGLQHTLAFGLFRFFDIVKPPPIRWLDARFKNGIGVMLDDVVAAFFTLLVFALWTRLA